MYAALCQILGTPIQVAIRRETLEFMETVERPTQSEEYRQIRSGSTREGFRLQGSDLDIMTWPTDYRVIWCKSMSQKYTVNHVLLLSDSSESPPGFTLLAVLKTKDQNIMPVICLNGKCVVPSLEFRRHAPLFGESDYEEHGPCWRTVYNGKELENVTCLACDSWPPSASLWITRSQILHWPDIKVVDDIVRNGCHLVPIGSPLGQHEHDEWRISFSLAEYEIVKSMNHSQFLVYGLLKIFLTEVINNQLDERNQLLCSYHLKTVIFWTIQQNPRFYWCPQNLHKGFWMCFKLILKWVYEGVCPNFFIPQNNMFLSKIHGAAQRSLFLQLHKLYVKGWQACLLESSSMKPYASYILNKTGVLKSLKVDYKSELFNEIRGYDPISVTKDLHLSKEILQTIENMFETPITQYQTEVLKKHTSTVIRRIAFKLHNTMKSNKGSNRFDIPCHMLKVAARLGFVSDIAYIAIYYYRTNRYAEALTLIGRMKRMLVNTQLCPKRIHSNCYLYVERCTTVSGEHNWLIKMIEDIKLPYEVCLIEELRREQFSALENLVMVIPLFVLMHFVEFLCNRHISTEAAQEALERLKNIVQRDQEAYIPDIYRDISWHILGICQQMYGDFQAAWHSYHQSLHQYPHSKIRSATLMRIQEMNISSHCKECNTYPSAKSDSLS